MAIRKSKPLKSGKDKQKSKKSSKRNTSRKVVKIAFWIFLIVIVLGFLLPQQFVMPVSGAGKNSYHPESFWYFPWGKSGTHKGVDIFAKQGTDVLSSTRGIVVFSGNIERGGNVILILGPKWRLHYYAHLKNFKSKTFSVVEPGQPVGTVGTTGNAAGKQPHLHYSICSLYPYPWLYDKSVQGWKKMFYLNPIQYF